MDNEFDLIKRSKMNKTKIEWCDFRKGNSRIKSDKYILVYCPGHPYAKYKGHILEHRYVMEKELKRYLEYNEHVHHINGNGQDNRIENLKLMSSSDHARLHYSKDKMKNGIIALNKYSQTIKFPRIEIFCKCGCGNKLINRDSKARLREYIRGHNTKGTHWRWNNGN